VASEESSFSNVANEQRWKELAVDIKNMAHACIRELLYTSFTLMLKECKYH